MRSSRRGRVDGGLEMVDQGKSRSSGDEPVIFDNPLRDGGSAAPPEAPGTAEDQTGSANCCQYIASVFSTITCCRRPAVVTYSRGGRILVGADSGAGSGGGHASTLPSAFWSHLLAGVAPSSDSNQHLESDSLSCCASRRSSRAEQVAQGPAARAPE